MTLEPSLHKQRGDFSHNYTKIRIKCPECIRTIKGKNHVKVFKNLAGLWRHIKLEHDDIINSVFNIDQIKDVLRNIAIAVEWGMLSDSSVMDTTTSLSILYNGKKLRKDVQDKLQEISDCLKMQLVYPNFKPILLKRVIEDKIGKRDDRTMKNYFDCVIKYSIKNLEEGKYDVSDFCNYF